MITTKDGSQEPRGDKPIAEMTFNEVKEELSKKLHLLHDSERVSK